jgi:DNA-binding LacI/PurR family transcriptional regulator
MSPSDHARVTQRQIAELAGVSQATVSLVLNEGLNPKSRIPEETRLRVLEVIRQTTYVADPVARSLAGVDNKILGVFTYEPAFPADSVDFYSPLLSGIEAGAEVLGCDLLMFTSAPVTGGKRQLFHENNRLRLADGFLLLGLEMDPDELAALTVGGFRAVAVGRRNDPDIPYVGLDYASATETLVARALKLGHDAFYYLHLASTGESVADRKQGFLSGLAGTSARVETRAATGSDLGSHWAHIMDFRPSVLFVESPAHAIQLLELARKSGMSVPGDLSMVVLGEPAREQQLDIDFTRLSPPRQELGDKAVRLLGRILSSDDRPSEAERRTLIDCAIVDGATLTSTSARAS